MEQKNTPRRIRLAANVETDIVEMIDSECSEKRCSRADVIRWAVLDRFAKTKRNSKRTKS